MTINDFNAIPALLILLLIIILGFIIVDRINTKKQHRDWFAKEARGVKQWIKATKVEHHLVPMFVNVKVGDQVFSKRRFWRYRYSSKEHYVSVEIDGVITGVFYKDKDIAPFSDFKDMRDSEENQYLTHP